MNAMKKGFALLMSLVLVLAMAIPALAAENSNTLTITSKTSGHTYQAYQVFQGDYHEGILSNVTWGGNVDGESLLTALKADETVGSFFTDCTTAKETADVLGSGSFQNNSELLDAVADVVAEHLTGTPKESSAPSGDAQNGYTYTITGLDDGYYFVKDKDDSLTGDNAYTKFMLQVVGNTTVAAKADTPVIDKVIDGDKDTDDSTTGDVDANTAAIGDKVPFKVSSKVPNMDGYEKYYFVVKDTLSEGLTFNNDVAVSVGGEALTKGTDYTVETDGQTFTIILKNFIRYKSQTGAEILITYSATLNEKAVIGTAGNKNSVDLTYSNNPNVSDDGTPGNPDKPGPNSPVGETPDADTYTYATGVKLTKVNAEGEKLAGAKFQISGEKLNIVQVNKTIFRESENGTYYLLKDGTYTTTAPTEENKASYDNTTITYEKVTVVDQNTVKEKITTEGYVNADGVLIFEGLGSGSYEITELVAPNGYNLLKDPIKITIGWQAPSVSGEDCTWTVTGGDATVNNGMIELTVQNQKGAQLPSTGGIGTTVFYIAGGVLVIGAAVLLVARKRMKAAEK